ALKPGNRTGGARSEVGEVPCGKRSDILQKKTLTSQSAWRLWKGADSQIGLAGLKLRLEVPGIERQCLQRNPRFLLGHFGQERGEKTRHSDIGRQKLECAVGGTRIEGRRWLAQRVGSEKKTAKRLRYFHGLLGRMHRLAV